MTNSARISPAENANAANSRNKKILALIDGKSVFYRGYYAMPNLMTKDGTPTGGVYGFATLALELFAKIQPDYVAVAWDKPKTNIRRRLAIYDKYKANRHPAPPDFYAQIPILHELLAAFGWPFYELDDYEADDIIGTFDRQAGAQNLRTIMISSDLDLLQLLDDDTELYALKKGLANLEKFDVAAFEQKYGIRVDQFLDLKSLKGDASDNIPGVAGIGEKTAVELLQKFGTLDNLYQNLDSDLIKNSVREKLVAGEKSAFMSRELAQIWCDAPLELDLAKADVRHLDVAKLRDELTKLEFTSLLRKLPDFMRELPAANPAPTTLEIRESSVRELDENSRNDLAKAEKLIVLIGEETDEKSAENSDNAAAKNSEKSAKNFANSAQGNLLDALNPARKYLLISRDETVAFKTDFAAGAEILDGKKIVTHDAKLLAEEFLARDLPPTFAVDFDTKMAKFLLNCLRKSPSLADAIGWTKTDENGELLPVPDGVAAGGLWSLFRDTENELKKYEKLYRLARTVDFPLQVVIAKIEARGVKLDVPILREMSGQLAAKIRDCEQEIWRMVGREFNVSSAPQLSDALFRDLNLPTAGIKKSLRGYYSTGKKELDKLRGEHPIIDKITEVRELLKLKNTYVDALPNLVASDGKLHTDFQQDITATGRLSSSNPNLQNIPTRTELGQQIRRAFVASPGKILVSADYSQFELRLAAALARDTNLIEDFQDDNVDIHTKTAAEAYGVAFDDVTPEMRRHAKVINFGVLYGMSPHGLAAATGMNFQRAREFIERYFRVRQPIRDFLDKTLEQAKTAGYVETLFGRRRPTPDVSAGNFAVREAAKRAAANMPIQGTEADLMKMAMLQVERDMSGICRQIMQIHDSILVECEPADAEKVGGQLKEIMENIYPPLGVRLKVDVKTGDNWSEL